MAEPLPEFLLEFNLLNGENFSLEWASVCNVINFNGYEYRNIFWMSKLPPSSNCKTYLKANKSSFCNED